VLVDRRRGDQDNARVVGHNLRVTDDLLQIGLVLLKRDVLLVGCIGEGSIVGAKKDSLSPSVNGMLD
jgi:hypothetical protein